MNAKKMIAAFAVLAMALAAFAVIPGEAISGDDDKLVELKGDFTSQMTLTSTQTVIVVDDLNIIDGGYLEILGDFIVKEGKTVTIEGEGSQLTLYGDAKIDGNIVSKVGDKTDASKAGLIINPDEGYDVTINGSITANGDTSGESKITVAMIAHQPENLGDNTKQNIIVNGIVTVGTNAIAIMNMVDFTADSKLIVLGDLSSADECEAEIGTLGVILAGYLYIDGAVSNSLKVSIAATSAVIEVKEVEGSLYVTDLEMYAYNYGGVEYYIGACPTEASVNCDEAVTYDADTEIFTDIDANEIKINDVKNVKVTETITTAIVYDKVTSANKMYAETKMLISALDAAKAVEALNDDDGDIDVNDGNTVYLDTMTLSGVDLDVDDGTLTVIGDVVFLGISDDVGFDNYATVTVEGSVLMKNGSINVVDGATLNAAVYTIKDADNKTDYYYTTLQKAIDNGATDIEMSGKLIVEKDLTVPAPVKLTTATIDDDNSVEIEDGATLTIANGAQFILNGDMLVDGSFVIENIDYGITLVLETNNIWADVLLTDGSYRMYTDIYNAFAKAKSGDEINAYNPVDGKIVLDKDLILPAGVVFDNSTTASTPVAKSIAVDDGVVFTIAGKLVLNDKANLQENGTNGFNDKTPATDAGEVKDYAVVVIGAQGLIEFTTSKPVYDDFKIAGAYYTMDGKRYISNIPLAFESILETDSKKVYIAGEVTIENINVTGTDKDRIVVNIVAGADVTMKGFTFAYGTVQAITGNDNSKAILKGDVGTSTGRIIFEKVETDSLMLEDRFVDGSMNLVINGTVESSKPTSIAGIVYFEGFGYYTVSVVGDTLEDRTFTIPAGTAAFVIGNTAIDGDIAARQLLVAGELKVTNKGHLYVNGPISVLGTLTVEKLDGKSGEIDASIFNVGKKADTGGSFDDDADGSALIAGSGKFKLDNLLRVYVLNGSSVTADVLKDWMDNTAVNTEYYIDGVLWETVYSLKGWYNIEWEVPAHSDYKIYGWQTYDEKTKTYTDVPLNTGVGAPGYEKVYANIDKEIYTINVNADQGIDNVYIDGVLMQKTVATNSYALKVAAGTHALSYTLANGYSGNAVITSIDGAKLVGGGLSFVVNDDKYDGPMDITLSGIQKSGYDTDPETHTETSSGLSVTEILLIVVVIIMAVMAIVLIMRLNRS